MAKLDLLVVQDLFLTETAQMADVVLPAASFAEKDGTFTNTERCVQRVRKAIEPPGDMAILLETFEKRFPLKLYVAYEIDNPPTGILNYIRLIIKILDRDFSVTPENIKSNSSPQRRPCFIHLFYPLGIIHYRLSPLIGKVGQNHVVSHFSSPYIELKEFYEK